MWGQPASVYILLSLQVYLILDEFIIAGEIQETSKKVGGSFPIVDTTLVFPRAHFQNPLPLLVPVQHRCEGLSLSMALTIQAFLVCLVIHAGHH